MSPAYNSLNCGAQASCGPMKRSLWVSPVYHLSLEHPTSHGTVVIPGPVVPGLKVQEGQQVHSTREGRGRETGGGIMKFHCN
jgi:hypothetical protein